MSKTVYKYDKKIRRWYREVDGKRQENLKLGVGYNTANGQYLFNSDGTRTKLNPSSSKPKNNYANWGLYDFTNTKPSSSLSTAPMLERALNWDLLKKTKIPFKPSREVQNEYARRELEARRYLLWLLEKKKEAQRIKDSSQVQEWGLLARYKKQLNDEANSWGDLLNEQYSRKKDARSINRGYKIKLVDGMNKMGKPTKYYYFYNPKTGELGTKVSKYYLKDNGYDMKGVTPVVFENLHDAQMVSLHKNSTHRDIIKRATNNIDHSSYDLANTAMGGALNFTPTNVIGGVAGSIRKGQSFLGAVSNTLFGQDFVDPRKSGNYGLLEISNPTANWAAKHPYATMAINAAGDIAAGRIIHGVGTSKFAGSAAGNATGKGVNYVLGKTGLATNFVKDLGAKGIKQGVLVTKRAIKSAPGGTRMTTFGRGALNTGKNAVGTVKGYGTRALQYIPLGARDWTANAARGTKNFFGRFKGVNMFNRGLRGVTGYRLTPNAKTGFKTLATLYGIGQGYLSGEDKSSSIIPVILPTSFDKAYNLYNKTNTAVDTYNNAMDMYDWDDYSAENIYNTGQGVINLFG